MRFLLLVSYFVSGFLSEILKQFSNSLYAKIVASSFFTEFLFSFSLVLLFIMGTKQEYAFRGSLVAGAIMGILGTAFAVVSLWLSPIESVGRTSSPHFGSIYYSGCQLLQIPVFALSLGIAVCWFRKTSLASSTALHDDSSAVTEKPTSSVV